MVFVDNVWLLFLPLISCESDDVKIMGDIWFIEHAPKYGTQMSVCVLVVYFI